MRGATSALVLSVLLIGGCGGDGDPPIERGELPKLVLQQEDLGAPWRPFDEGRQVQADTVPGAREDLTRFGRVEGWKSRFRRPGSPQTQGLLVVESRADLFDSVDGARDDLEAYDRQFEEERESLGGRALAPPSLGDGAVAVTYRQGSGAGAVRHYHLAWVVENATASLLVNGFDGKVKLADALELAKLQQRRLARAAAS